MAMNLFDELVERSSELTLNENDNTQLEITNAHNEVYYIDFIRSSSLLLMHTSLSQIELEIITPPQIDYLNTLVTEPKLMKSTKLLSWPNEENVHLGISTDSDSVTAKGLEQDFQTLVLARYALISNFCNPF